jgi:3-dehydrosphinganine reductase
VFGLSSYTGPKFALVGLAVTLRQELGPRGIHVSVLCPADTDTPGYLAERAAQLPETKYLSAGALLKPETVAARFLTKLAQKKFLITVNLESAIFTGSMEWPRVWSAGWRTS